MNGFAVARWVHANKAGVRTVIVSGRAAPRAGDMPPHAHVIAKPYDLNVLS